MIIPNYNEGTVDVYLGPQDLYKGEELASIFSKFGVWGGLNTYGGGKGNTLKDTQKVERTGALGEKAFSKITGLAMNEERKEKGDDGFDFKIPAFSIDVKCHMSYYEQAIDWGFYGEFFTKAHLINGVYVKPRAEVLVFGAIISGDSWSEKYGNDWDEISVDSKQSTCLIIRFFGAISSKAIFNNYKERLGYPFQKGGPNNPSDNFKNYYIKKEELIPMIDFLFEHKKDLLTTKSGVII